MHKRRASGLLFLFWWSRVICWKFCRLNRLEFYGGDRFCLISVGYLTHVVLGLQHVSRAVVLFVVQQCLLLCSFGGAFPAHPLLWKEGTMVKMAGAYHWGCFVSATHSDNPFKLPLNLSRVSLRHAAKQWLTTQKLKHDLHRGLNN